MLFTSEQVSRGHPDKICDQISDAIVTDCLRHDKNARVAVECMIKDYEIILAGEMTSDHVPDYEALGHEVLCRIGVPDVEKYHVTPLIACQSRDMLSVLIMMAQATRASCMAMPPTRRRSCSRFRLRLQPERWKSSVI